MAKRNRLEQTKPLFLLALVIACWWLISAITAQLTRATFYEFQAPFYSATSQIQDLHSYWTLRNQSKEELIEAGRDLSRQNSFYASTNQEIASLRQENARLEQLLNLRAKATYRYEYARVDRRDLNAWWQHLIIRKGRNYNIPEGAAVVYKGGIVGKVKEVYAFTSVVELITSPGFRMAAKLEDYTATPVKFNGLVNHPFAPPMGEIEHVPPDVNLNELKSLRIVSTNLGGIFPEGRTIGTLVNLEKSADGYFQKGQVELNVDLNSLREVAVLIKFEPEEESFE